MVGARSPSTLALWEPTRLAAVSTEWATMTHAPEHLEAEVARVARETALRDRAFHGTTTVAFCIEGGVVCAVDSRASLGAFVGSSATEKVIPLSRSVLGTMAGSAADCSEWLRLISASVKLLELERGDEVTASAVSRLLSSALRRQPSGLGLSVGTMILGCDVRGTPSLFYVDSDGARVRGELFAVGSGAAYAYSVLDAGYRRDLDLGAAAGLAEAAVRTAATRDAFSGGFVNVYFVDANTRTWSRITRGDTDDTDFAAKATPTAPAPSASKFSKRSALQTARAWDPGALSSG